MKILKKDLVVIFDEFFNKSYIFYLFVEFQLHWTQNPNGAYTTILAISREK